jgi:alpha-mannosidase
VRQGYEFNYKLTAMQLTSHTGELPAAFSFVKADSDNVVVTAVKKTEDGDGLLLRFYEWAGKGGNVTLTVPRGALSATLANLMEKPEGAPLELRQARQVIVPVTPFQIQTVIVCYSTPNQSFLANISKP